MEYEDDDGANLKEPGNLPQILARAQLPRRSLSPSVFTLSDFKEFRRQNAAARKEKQVSESVMPIIEGKIKQPKCRSGGIMFGNLRPLTDGNITPGNPDIFYGSRPEKFQAHVLEDLQDLVLPSTQRDLPALPNFSIAVKGPRGLYEVAELQARYDGALGARAMHATFAYGNMRQPDQNAYAVTSIFHGGTLSMYTSHEIHAAGQTKYAMTQIGGWALTGSQENFVEGARAYRNLRDWAEEQRNAAIGAANEAGNLVKYSASLCVIAL